VILVDSNVFMYAAGAEHAAKQPSARFLEAVAGGQIEACVDAEVLQEILHRYWAIKRPTDGNHVYDLTRQIVSTVLPITAGITDAARDLLAKDPSLSARDALHAAVVLQNHLEIICSYDDDFDRIEGLSRRTPDQILAGHAGGDQ